LFTRKGVEWLQSLNLEPIECYLRIIEVLNGEIHQLSRRLRRLARDDEDVRLLMTIPRIGYYLALLIKAEIGDISRFRSGDHLCSYVGIVPLTHSSEGVARRGRITREGSAGCVGLRLRLP